MFSRVYSLGMSSDRGPGSEVGTRLGYLFKHAGMRLEELNVKALAPFGINQRELAVLLLIAAHEPASQQQAAQRLDVDRTTMVAILDSLEEKGLVSRHADAEDRRRNVVELTGTGLKTLRLATKASDEAEQALLAPLTTQEAQLIRQALRLIVEHRQPEEV
jgi:DNA-binding MarR family transcriptional regulator